MIVLKWLGKFFGTLTDRIICIVVVLLLSQVPTYISQYRDVLAGAHDTARIHYLDIERDAKRFGKNVMPFLEGIRERNDPEASALAVTDIKAVKYYLELDESIAQLNQASIFTRPFVLAANYQDNLHQLTIANFEPNVPLTPEALAYAAVGLFLSIGLVGLFKYLGRESYAYVKEIAKTKRGKRVKNPSPTAGV